MRARSSIVLVASGLALLVGAALATTGALATTSKPFALTAAPYAALANSVKTPGEHGSARGAAAPEFASPGESESAQPRSGYHERHRHRRTDRVGHRHRRHARPAPSQVSPSPAASPTLAPAPTLTPTPTPTTTSTPVTLTQAVKHAQYRYIVVSGRSGQYSTWPPSANRLT